MRRRGAEFETGLGLLAGTQQGQAGWSSSKANLARGNRCCWPRPATKQAGGRFAYSGGRQAEPGPLRWTRARGGAQTP
jgi:hypothetical protein